MVPVIGYHGTHGRLKQDDLAARLLAIGHNTASRMSAETRRVDHRELLYDERGLRA